MVCLNSIHNFSKLRFTPEKATIIRETLSRPALSEMGDSFVSSVKRAEQTNPLLEAVKKAVPMVKEPRVKIAENLRSMILDTASAVSEAWVHSNGSVESAREIFDSLQYDGL